jgi:carbon storage regulator
MAIFVLGTEANMLVLTRKADEQIWIGDQITIQVLEIRPTSVRLGIEAPREIPITRPEVKKWPKEEGEEKRDAQD